MKQLPDACADLLATATGLQLDALPANPMDRVAVLLACLVIESRADKQTPPAKPLAPADAASLEALLPAAFNRVKARPWKTADLTKSKAWFDPPDHDLRAALNAIPGRLGKPGNLGKFLKRCSGCEAGGFRLEPVDRDGNQNVWRIRPTGSKTP